MTGLVRGLLAAPIAALVGWLGAHGIGADPDLVGAVLGAVVAGLMGAGMHAAEDRWPWLRRVVGWLAREVPKLAQTGPDGVSIITTAPPSRTSGGAHVSIITPAPSSPATPPAGPPADTPPGGSPG